MIWCNMRFFNTIIELDYEGVRYMLKGREEFEVELLLEIQQPKLC